jgi:hypothetical protein
MPTGVKIPWLHAKIHLEAKNRFSKIKKTVKVARGVRIAAN